MLRTILFSRFLSFDSFLQRLLCCDLVCLICVFKSTFITMPSPRGASLAAILTISFLCTPSPSRALAYDYIIIGGGTCGLTVANRLSELPNVTVAVIEAGASVLNNPNVTNVDDFTVALGTPIDWQYKSTNQTYAVGQQITYHSGKALGGSSTINGMLFPNWGDGE